MLLSLSFFIPFLFPLFPFSVLYFRVGCLLGSFTWKIKLLSLSTSQLPRSHQKFIGEVNTTTVGKPPLQSILGSGFFIPFQLSSSSLLSHSLTHTHSLSRCNVYGSNAVGGLFFSFFFFLPASICPVIGIATISAVFLAAKNHFRAWCF